MKVIWKYNGKEEQSKSFINVEDAFRFQAKLLKNKNDLEYAKYE